MYIPSVQYIHVHTHMYFENCSFSETQKDDDILFLIFFLKDLILSIFYVPRV